MAVHSGTHLNFNLITFVREHVNKKYYIELAHRLDKNTSGCLVIVKNKSFLIEFQRLLIKKKIKKEYHVFVKGEIGKKINTILYQSIISKYNESIKKRDNITQNLHKNLNKYLKKYSLLKLFLITGKKHQARIHLLHIGYPIIMDKNYGNNLINENNHNIKLHAKSLKFKCPSSKKKFYIKAKYNKNFARFVKNLKELFNYEFARL